MGMAHWLEVPSLIAMILTVAAVFAIRVAALRFGIQVPTALDIPGTISKVKARPRASAGRQIGGPERPVEARYGPGPATADRSEAMRPLNAR